MAKYVVQGKVTSKIDGKPVPCAIVEIFEVDQKAGIYIVAPLVTAPTPLVTGEKNGYFKGSFDFVGKPVDKRPDIIFRVSQKVSEVTKYIYNENPAIHTRWNIADVLYADIKVEADVVTIDDPPISQPLGDYFIFTRVGDIPVAKISQTNGYAYPNTGTDPNPRMDSNQPFGATLRIGGWFGKELLDSTKLKYYKIQYAEGAHLPTDTPENLWKDIADPLVNWWYYKAKPPEPPEKSQWIAESMGPLSKDTEANLYKLPWDTDKIAWSFEDLLIDMDTTKPPLTAGLYTLRVKGYDEALKEKPVNPDANYGSLKLQLDNTPPDVKITEVKHTSALGKVTGGPTATTTCPIFPFTDGTVSVDFEAHDPRGHLRLYRLYALYGHYQIVVPPPTSPNKAEDDYSAHVGPTPPVEEWKGLKTLKVEYKAPPPESDATYNDLEMPTCAYQFRLRVDKRTTDGHGLVYWGYEDNYHVTIKREP